MHHTCRFEMVALSLSLTSVRGTLKHPQDFNFLAYYQLIKDMKLVLKETMLVK